jgi:hypothetical protein
MRVAALAVLVVSAWAACDTSTCAVCKTLPACAWYSSAGFSDCRSNTSDVQKLGLTPVATCPVCQAGSCAECQAQSGCSWYQNSVGALGGTCGTNTTIPTAPPGTSYTLLATCPVCPQLSTCTACTNNTNCGWYVLAGAAGKCAEASPGFAYSRVTSTFCGGNVCAAQETCNKCQGVNATSGGDGGKPCAWFTPKSGFSAFYNSKCDINETGVVQGAFYDTTAVGVCPVCAGSTCTSCVADTTCKWVAVQTLGLTSFGQCLLKTAANPTGKDTISTCPKTCEVFSCAACVLKSECRWFSGSSVGLGDTCDRAADSIQHPTHGNVVSASANCPACKSSRCFECNSEGSTCTWNVPVFPGTSTDVPGFDGSCSPTVSPPATTRKVPTTDKKCKGNPNAAAGLAPGVLGLVLAVFVYHN